MAILDFKTSTQYIRTTTFIEINYLKEHLNLITFVLKSFKIVSSNVWYLIQKMFLGGSRYMKQSLQIDHKIGSRPQNDSQIQLGACDVIIWLL